MQDVHTPACHTQPPQITSFITQYNTLSGPLSGVGYVFFPFAGNEENKNTCHQVVPGNRFKPPSCDKQEVLNVPEDNHIYHYVVDVNRFQSENGTNSVCHNLGVVSM